MNDAKRIRTERMLDDVIAKARLLRVQLSIAAEGVPDWIDTPLRDSERLLMLKAEIAAARLAATEKGLTDGGE